MKNAGRYLKEFAGALGGAEQTGDNGRKWKLAKLPKFLESSDWEDVSWHNNECPSFRNEKLGIDLWINFLNREDGYKNYAVDNIDKEGEYKNTPLCTNHISDVNAYIAKRERAHAKKLKAFHDKAIKVAKAFSKKLRGYLSYDQMKDVVSLNNADKDKSVCHSHDFCDANMFMADGFKAVTGRLPELNVEADCDLFNAAWTIAKNNGFYKSKSKRPY
jgi:hypothetical protein